MCLYPITSTPTYAVAFTVTDAMYAIVGANNTVLVKAATQATQASAVAGAASTE